MAAEKYTVVQHSGYGYKQNPQFRLAVESRRCVKNADIRQVMRAGGLLFDTYDEAEAFCKKANYPPGNNGLIPTVRGQFSQMMVDDLKIYIPVREAVC